MIEPTSRDLDRTVVWRRGDGSAVLGRLTGFDGDKVYLKVDGARVTVQRGQLDWPDAATDPRAIAARGVIEGAGFTIAVIDQHVWEIERFSFWPALGTFRWPNGTMGYGGAGKMVEAIRAAKRPPEPDPGDAERSV